jgi:hypothetical protein
MLDVLDAPSAYPYDYELGPFQGAGEGAVVSDVTDHGELGTS